MVRVPYVRYLRYRHFERLRHGSVLLAFLNAVATAMGVTAEYVFNLLKHQRMTAEQVAALANSGAKAPANTVAPALTGTPTVGQTLTVTNGTWTGTPAPTYTRQWLRDGVAIAGATGTTYALVADDATHTITVSVTATNDVSSASAVSNGLGPVAAS